MKNRNNYESTTTITATTTNNNNNSKTISILLYCIITVIICAWTSQIPYSDILALYCFLFLPFVSLCLFYFVSLSHSLSVSVSTKLVEIEGHPPRAPRFHPVKRHFYLPLLPSAHGRMLGLC